MKGMVYLPTVGAVLGLMLAVVFDFGTVALGLPPLVAAAMATATGWTLTGCFHEDGLCDSADGIGGGWNRAQILKIMTDSRVGTYGCAAMVLYTITKLQLLAALDMSYWKFGSDTCSSRTVRDCLGSCQGAGPALIISQMLARLTSPYMIRRWDYIDDQDGPKSSFYAFMIQAKLLVTRPRVIIAVSYCFIVSTFLYGPYLAVVLILAVLLFAHRAGKYGERILGGVMGDYLGATICLCELLVLTVLLIGQNYQQQQSSSSLRELVSQLHNMLTADNDVTNLFVDNRFMAIAKFVVMCGAYWTWCWLAKNVAYQSPDDSRSDTKNNETTESKETKPKEDARSAVRSEASRILERPTSTFRERYDATQTYLDALAKPVGSLGLLESWAARLAALQRTLEPTTDRVACLIFAGDHGAAAAPADGGEGCSLYPQAVTRSVLVGLQRGVAGASVLSKANDVTLRVVDVGVVGEDTFQGGNVISSPSKLVDGTRNFCKESAMSSEQCKQCIQIGKNYLKEVVAETKSKVVVLGEVGIGNTTSSSALIAALTSRPPEQICGGGAFATRELQESAVAKKISIVKKALSLHFAAGNDGVCADNVSAVDAIEKLGGAEIASMVGAMLQASELDLAILVDGFIVTAAALVAVSMDPRVCRVLFFASRSAESGQGMALEKIKAISRANDIPYDETPALSMGLRMGEATAGLLAVNLLRSSAAVLSSMATIQEILS